MKPDFARLRPQLDLEGKYVDFGVLRTSLSVLTVIKDLETNPSGPNKDGECRATCPKCGKERAFALNVNTNRFNCFTKGCTLKGGGVIDLIAKLCEVPAKEASHLLACAYGIQPYTREAVGNSPQAAKPAFAEISPLVSVDPPKRNRETITRAEFDELQARVDRLSQIVWSQLFESGTIEETDPEIFDEKDDHELKAALSAA